MNYVDHFLYSCCIRFISNISVAAVVLHRFRRIEENVNIFLQNNLRTRREAKWF